jgi:hypothetical protein
MELQSFNLLEDFDKHPEWNNRFDLINQRLLMSALSPSQWRLALKRFMDLLKPGGYLQLFEFDYSQESLSVGKWYQRSVEWYIILAEKKGIKPLIIEELPVFLKEIGFNILSKEYYHTDFNSAMLEEEPFPGAAAHSYKETSRAICSESLKTGIVTQDEWQEYDEGIETEWETSDRTKWVHRCGIIVAQVWV